MYFPLQYLGCWQYQIICLFVCFCLLNLFIFRLLAISDHLLVCCFCSLYLFVFRLLAISDHLLVCCFCLLNLFVKRLLAISDRCLCAFVYSAFSYVCLYVRWSRWFSSVLINYGQLSRRKERMGSHWKSAGKDSVRQVMGYEWMICSLFNDLTVFKVKLFDRLTLKTQWLTPWYHLRFCMCVLCDKSVVCLQLGGYFH